MKIGINGSFLRKQGSGIGQVTVNFLRKLTELSIADSKVGQNEFIIYLEEDLDFDFPENFRKVVFLPLWKRDDIIRAIWWQKYLLPKKAEKDGCDVFISMYQSATIFSASIRHIMVVHDILLEFFPAYLNNSRKRYLWKLTKKAIKSADKIIAVSHRTEKDLIQQLGIDAGKITVVYNDIDPIYKNEVSKDESARVLEKYQLEPGYVYNGGGLEIRKNTENVLRAYKKMLKEKAAHEVFPKLVISGKLMPELSPLVCDAEKLILELKLNKKVELLGYVPQEDLPALYRNASLFIYPSHYEGFGLPVLEAMNQGVPVITSKSSSLPEVGSDSVLYCKPDDIDDIAMVMRNVLLNKPIREALSQKGKNRALFFSWEKFTKKILNIAHEL